MALIVQKFGGSSVKNAERIFNVARIITDTYKEGNDVVVSLSAQGDTTDELIEKAKEINENPSKREMDMLMSTGEQASVALCAMAIEKLGYPVISLNAWQAGVRTDSNYGSARIKDLADDRIRAELNRKNIVLVTGFQGVNRFHDITTLGRGASDLSAVALAAKLDAEVCRIYTDVEGVFTADPRIVKDAKKLDEITFDEMLELASLGAQVLQNRSVELAKRYGVHLEVLSSLADKPGTLVKEIVNKMESTAISGVAKDENVASIALTQLEDVPGVAHKIFSLLAKSRINVDIILQSIGRDNTKDITFTVKKDSCAQAKQILLDNKEALNFTELTINDKLSKISIVGSGMINNPGIASLLFEALYNVGINIHMISTSEIKVSVLIDLVDSDRAVQAVHEKFFSKNAF
ncbi:MAG: aspartate kinase [Oscillospiraceae bacterium]|jgi:aspartate kinase|nr:aspartate kinase [Oscillospiraceae bacterium]